MTSDYLNAAMLDVAEKGQFLVVPKDLMAHALELNKGLISLVPSSSSIKTYLETSAQI